MANTESADEKYVSALNLRLQRNLISDGSVMSKRCPKVAYQVLIGSRHGAFSFSPITTQIPVLIAAQAPSPELEILLQPLSRL